MKLVIIIFAYLLLPGQMAKNTNNKVSNKTINLVLDKIDQLPEVKSFFKTTNKKYKPVSIFGDEPNEQCKFYWVKVGISNNDMLRSNFNFFIDKKTYKIFYLDVMCDSVPQYITLKQWRHWRNTKEFNSMHIFKNGKLIVIK